MPLASGWRTPRCAVPPVDTAALESRLDHELIGAFGAAAADRVPSGLEGGVVRLCQAFGEVGHRAIPCVNGSPRVSSELNWQLCKSCEHLPHSIRRVFERVRLLV